MKQNTLTLPAGLRPSMYFATISIPKVRLLAGANRACGLETAEKLEDDIYKLVI
jgi:hypothetical protein